MRSKDRYLRRYRGKSAETGEDIPDIDGEDLRVDMEAGRYIEGMVEGVATGFQKRLDIQGVGYRAQAQGSKLVLNVGYSKPVEMEMPDGVSVAVENSTQVIVSGIDKEAVGNIAAKIREVRPPEPYKGKGIRYLGEVVRRKVGKAGGKGAKGGKGGKK